MSNNYCSALGALNLQVLQWGNVRQGTRECVSCRTHRPVHVATVTTFLYSPLSLQVNLIAEEKLLSIFMEL